MILTSKHQQACLFGPPIFQSSWIAKHISRPCNSTSVFTLVHRCCVWWCHSPKDEEAAVGSSRGLKMFSYCFIMTRPPSWGHLPLCCRRWRTPPPPPRPCQRKFVNTFAVKRTHSRITSIGVSANRNTGISKPGQFLWLAQNVTKNCKLMPFPFRDSQQFWTRPNCFGLVVIVLVMSKIFLTRRNYFGHESKTKIQY